jgi:hypothetical protein
MKKITIEDLGSVVYWEDYIKTIRNEEDEVTYLQSNTPTKDYSPRMVGICIGPAGNYYVAVAVAQAKSAKSTYRTGRGVVNSRLRNAIAQDGNIEATDRGVTMVPVGYTEYLCTDYYTIKNLLGFLDKTSLKVALALLNENAPTTKTRARRHRSRGK